ncbi:hypothetical protein LJR153_002412 [Paenibacillus sp. LjRoot153]
MIAFNSTSGPGACDAAGVVPVDAPGVEVATLSDEHAASDTTDDTSTADNTVFSFFDANKKIPSNNFYICFTEEAIRREASSSQQQIRYSVNLLLRQS